MNELSAVFPFSRLQETGIISVEYISQNKPVEPKSLKYYLISSRKVGNSKENVTSMIFNDLYPFLEIKELLIKAFYITSLLFETLCKINSNE